MKILYVTSEASPFCKTGGLADVAGSLPPALAAAGDEVAVILPLYGQISSQWKEQMTFCGSMYVDLAWRHEYCGLFCVEHKGVTWLQFGFQIGVALGVTIPVDIYARIAELIIGRTTCLCGITQL